MIYIYYRNTSVLGHVENKVMLKLGEKWHIHTLNYSMKQHKTLDHKLGLVVLVCK